jgi:protein-S-isoprenylcysteine O-methyltransferase Ste14
LAIKVLIGEAKESEEVLKPPVKVEMVLLGVVKVATEVLTVTELVLVKVAKVQEVKVGAVLVTTVLIILKWATVKMVHKVSPTKAKVGSTVSKAVAEEQVILTVVPI